MTCAICNKPISGEVPYQYAELAKAGFEIPFHGRCLDTTKFFEKLVAVARRVQAKSSIARNEKEPAPAEKP